MSDPIFLTAATAVSLTDIAVLTTAALAPDQDGAVAFARVAALDDADRISVSFYGDAEAGDLSATRAGACFVRSDMVKLLPAGTVALIVDDPVGAFARLVAALYPAAGRPVSDFATRGISPAAFIHPEARLEADVTIDPGVVVGPRAEIGSGTTIGANSVIGSEVRIGRGCALGAQVTVTHALLGNRVILQPGVRIGQDSSEPDGLVPGAVAGTRIPGLGRVIVQDDADIGANTTIDRGCLGDTVIGEGARVASLVHVGRDRMIARHSVVRG